MRPALGRIVHYHQGDREAAQWDLRFKISGRTAEEAEAMISRLGERALGNDGERWHAAVITKVWNETAVNLLVMFADGTVAPRRSVEMLPDEMFAYGERCAVSGWRWPKREG